MLLLLFLALLPNAFEAELLRDSFFLKPFELVEVSASSLSKDFSGIYLTGNDELYSLSFKQNIALFLFTLKKSKLLEQ